MGVRRGKGAFAFPWLSKFWTLQSGVSQGGILSPIIFVIYGSDMALWLKHLSALTYADDTSLSVRAKLLTDVTQRLEARGRC